MDSKTLQCYICRFCNLKFKNSNDLNLHNQLHTGTGEFSCPLCKETFRDLTELQLHDLQHSLEEIKDDKKCSPQISLILPASSFPCNMCNKVFLSHEELFDHVTQHEVIESVIYQSSPESSDEYKKTNDNKPAITDTAFRKSYQKLTTKPSSSDINGSYECKTCKKIFNGPSSLNRHQRRFHLNKRKYLCTSCLKTFTNMSLLGEHCLNHYKINEREFECYICKKHLSSSKLLCEHIFISHVDENKYSCQVCLKLFSNKDNLMSHMEEHIAAFNCKVCKKWYKTKSKLNNHRCACIGPRPYPCRMCGKRFSRLHHLQRHCYMHDRKQGLAKMLGIDSEHFEEQKSVNESSPANCAEDVLIHLKKKYECYICNTRWYSFKNYEQHFLSEHEELEFNSCPVCFKKFNKTCEVKRHLATHSKEKLFKCNCCSNSYSVEASLNRHKKKEHNGQDSLSCYHCAKTFNNKLAFQKHILKHEQSRKSAFKCTLCDKKFFKEKLFDQHILEYHDFFKEYQCILCNRNFSTIDDLKFHKLIHTKQKNL